MSKTRDTFTKAQFKILRQIERRFLAQGGSGLRDFFDAIIEGLEKKLNEDNGEVPDITPCTRDEASEENLVPESKAGIIAKARQQQIQGFFNNHNLGHIKVPLPNISDKEFKIRQKKNQALFFRPATKDLSYEDFMRALGQGNHWTVTDEAERAKIGWESAEQGYWFWAEVQEQCPRLGVSWNNLSKKLNLLSLEEYVIVFHTHKALTNTLIDQNTWTWLRTRYQHADGSGALDVRGWGGLVDVHRCWPRNLQDSYDDVGGRLAEAV